MKTTVRYHLIPVRMAIIKNSTNKCWKACEKREPFNTVGGNVSWYNHYGKQHGGSCKTELAYNPAVPLLGIYPDKTVIQNDTCTPMFMVKTWKQAKCPSTDECIKKMGYIHTMDYY